MILIKELLEQNQTIKIKGYHSTSPDNIDSIMTKGLVPGISGPSGQEWDGEWSGKGIYFHTTFPDHEMENGHDGENIFICTFEFEFDAEIKLLRPDEEASSDLSSNGALQVLKDGGALAYLGTIPARSIKKIYMPDLGDELNQKHADDFGIKVSDINWVSVE